MSRPTQMVHSCLQVPLRLNYCIIEHSHKNQTRLCPFPHHPPTPPPPHKDGDYARAQAAGVTCVPLLVETFGGLSPALMHELRAAAEWRSNKLTSSEYDETTWSARTWLTFVAQRLSVAVQLSVAQEAAEALGLSVAADPRAR